MSRYNLTKLDFFHRILLSISPREHRTHLRRYFNIKRTVCGILIGNLCIKRCKVGLFTIKAMFTGYLGKVTFNRKFLLIHFMCS